MTHAETPARQRRPRKEAVRLGKGMYQRDILPQAKAITSESTSPSKLRPANGPSPTLPASRWSICGHNAQTLWTSCASGSATGRSAAQ